jgi:precorrin isomerase
MDECATEILYNKVVDGSLKHIVTDVTMAASGIRKGALERLGIQVHSYINDPRMKQIADEKGITRSQACMQQAAEEYPEALYVVGNAPTALFEICDLVRKGKMHPAGIIAAPVGFVHVCESKHAVKTLKQIPKIIVEGRKGGSNLAATLCNAILTFDDAEQLKPGRDL